MQEEKMNKREEILDEIIRIESEMFKSADNIGGKAPCQDDLKSFRIMRCSRSVCWSNAVLKSYLDDLKKAKEEKRNIVAEAYARMMKSTYPSDYAKIEHLLPTLDPQVLFLIDKIMAIELTWRDEITNKYPYISSRGRPIRSSEDSPGVTSFETYLRGELTTYSKRTLELYYKNILDLDSKSINGGEEVLAETVRHYGYTSLKEANESLRNTM
jgi:hypothetical protein